MDSSPNDPPEYDPKEEEQQIRDAEERLLRKKAAGLIRPRVERPAASPSVPQAPAPAKKRVKVIRDENGAITGFEQD